MPLQEELDSDDQGRQCMALMQASLACYKQMVCGRRIQGSTAFRLQQAPLGCRLTPCGSRSSLPSPMEGTLGPLWQLSAAASWGAPRLHRAGA